MRNNFKCVNKNLLILINKLFCLLNKHFGVLFGLNKFTKIVSLLILGYVEKCKSV